MASRTYLVYDGNSSSVSSDDGPALEAANKVFKTFGVDSAFISRTPTVLTANSPAFGGKKVYVGTIAKKSDSFNFASFMGSVGDVNFVSESFLGREPVRSECLAQICEAIKSSGGNCEYHTTFYDNGC